MPEIPRRPCTGGCGRLVERGRCNVCALKRGGTPDGKAAWHSLYDWRWRKEAKLYLAEHPVCADPYKRHGEIVVLADEVDHIIPHKGDVKLFWDKKNWQGLCKPDHSRKTASEGGFGSCFH